MRISINSPKIKAALGQLPAKIDWIKLRDYVSKLDGTVQELELDGHIMRFEKGKKIWYLKSITKA